MLTKAYPPISSDKLQSLLELAKHSTAGSNTRYATSVLHSKIKAAKERYRHLTVDTTSYHKEKHAYSAETPTD